MSSCRSVRKGKESSSLGYSGKKTVNSRHEKVDILVVGKTSSRVSVLGEEAIRGDLTFYEYKENGDYSHFWGATNNQLFFRNF